jgi:hypothetical protein
MKPGKQFQSQSPQKCIKHIGINLMKEMNALYNENLKT